MVGGIFCRLAGNTFFGRNTTTDWERSGFFGDRGTQRSSADLADFCVGVWCRHASALCKHASALCRHASALCRHASALFRNANALFRNASALSREASVLD